MVASSISAVCEDGEETGVQVSPGPCHTLWTYQETRVMVVPTQGGQSHMSSLLCRLLKRIEDRSHEGFAARGTWTPAGGQTARAQGCSWHGSCWLDKPSVWGLPKPRGAAELWCTSLLPQNRVRVAGLPPLVLAPTNLPRHRFALPAAS